jgi:PBP1b-binding outer membrane lipoprotein LpoB
MKKLAIIFAALLVLSVFVSGCSKAVETTTTTTLSTSQNLEEPIIKDSATLDDTLAPEENLSIDLNQFDW